LNGTVIVDEFKTNAAEKSDAIGVALDVIENEESSRATARKPKKTTQELKCARYDLVKSRFTRNLRLVLLPLITRALPNDAVYESIVVVSFDKIPFEPDVNVFVCYERFDVLRLTHVNASSQMIQVVADDFDCLLF
jgi:hypothetical protein